MSNTKKHRKRETFAGVVLRCSQSMFDKVLNGDRNLSFQRARKAANVLGTDVTVWMDPKCAAERKSAWKKFSKEVMA